MTLRHLFTISALTASLCFSAGKAIASTPQQTESFEMWPGAQYSPSIPTVKSVLGYNTGERITTHSDMLT